MRRTVLVGAVLTVVATVVVLLSDPLDLELESVTLLGVALGAVVALVPDRRPAARLVGLAAGLVAAWVGYLLRAGVLPDSAGGRAVAVGTVLALCVGMVVVTLDRVPLWATLVGAAALAGAYEHAFVAAPPEVVAASTSAATSLLTTTAVGFLLVSLLAATPAVAPGARRGRAAEPQENDPTALDDLMEAAR